MMALIAISANAQTVIGEIDWSKEEAFNNWCSGENGSTAVVGAEGLEINVPAAGENYWNPQTVVLNVEGSADAAFLEENGQYKVIITAKHPAGHLRVNLGSWGDGVSLQKDFDVAEATDFEDIVVDFSEGWPADCFSNVHVLWMSGKLPGLSVIKSVKIMWDSPTPYNPADIRYNFIAKGKMAEVISNPNKKYRGVVEIPATVIHDGKEYTVSKIADNAFANCGNLISVTIPNSVTSIGRSVFNNCSCLTSVTIGNSVTSIGESAFYGCGSLVSANIPKSVTSIGSHAFYGCGSLVSANIPKSVTSIGSYAFFGCRGLTSFKVENGNQYYDSRNDCNALIETASNTLIVGCNNSTIPNSVTSIGNSAFNGCTGLTSVTIPNSVISIGLGAFSDCI